MLALLLAFAVLGLLFYRQFRASSPSSSDQPRRLSRPTRAQRLVAEAFEFSAGAADAAAQNVLVLYATEYGFAKEVARRACERLVQARGAALRVRVLNVLDYACVDFAKEDAVMLVASTTGDGVPPNEAADFKEALSFGRVTFGEHLLYAVLALGDKAYPHFCRGGEVLMALMEKESGVKGCVEIGRVDQEDMDVIDEWLESFIEAIPAERRAYVDEITPAKDVAGVTSQKLSNNRSHSIAGEEEDADYLVKAVEKYSASLDEASVRYSRNEPFMATVSKKEVLAQTPTGSLSSGKSVIRVEFDVSTADLVYSAGDALGVVPTNNVDEVEKMLQALAAVGDELVVGGAGGSGAFSAPADAMAEPLSFRDALMTQLDLKTVKPELISALGLASDDPHERVWAKELADDSTGGHFTEAGRAYAEVRHVIDVLGDFPGAALTPPEIARLLRPLTARYYSISSTPAVSRNVVAITVDVLRYQTLNTPREGVASTFLCDRVVVDSPHSRVGIFVSRNDNFRLPKDPATPVVMIGPGTGIAPFVAFLDERVEDDAPGRNILFFGCRHAEQDFLYRDKLEGLVQAGKLELETAFSRDQPEKIYVQDRMRARGADLWRVVDSDGAHVYICGDGRHMARDVDAALSEIFSKHGKMSAKAADAYRESLAEKGRMQRDVWVP